MRSHLKWTIELLISCLQNSPCIRSSLTKYQNEHYQYKNKNRATPLNMTQRDSWFYCLLKKQCSCFRDKETYGPKPECTHEITRRVGLLYHSREWSEVNFSRSACMRVHFDDNKEAGSISSASNRIWKYCLAGWSEKGWQQLTRK